MIRVFESFAGVGSQRMALENIGVEFEVVGISEVDKNALLSYDIIHNEQVEVEPKTKQEMLQEFEDKHIAYDFSTGKSQVPRKEEDIKRLYDAHIRSKNYGDIARINPNDLPDFDFFTYSFPCKNISTAGKQAGLEEGSNTQSSLLWECRKIIVNKKPKYLLMENVKNLVGKKHKEHFDRWCQELEDLGYTNYWDVLNGKDYGVPQNRERVIMISILNDTEKTFILPKKANKPVTSIEDILDTSNDNFNYLNKEFIFIKDIPTTKTGKIEHVGKDITTTFCERQRLVHINGITPTAKAMDGGSTIKILVKNKTNRQVFENNGYVVRYLNPLEFWRLMGYKDEHYYKAKELGLSKHALYERAGRGIVVPMLEEIFKNLFL